MAGGHPPKNDMQQAEQTFGCLDESVVFEYVAGEVFEKQNCAIYFGASWCPDCTSTTHKVGELLGPELGAGGGISLLYVSSDRTEESRQEYARKLLSSVEQVGGNKVLLFPRWLSECYTTRCASYVRLVALVRKTAFHP